MTYLLKLATPEGTPRVLLTLAASDVDRPALDVIFHFVGETDPAELVADKLLPADQAGDLLALRSRVFDRDAQGLFIRDGVAVRQDGQDLDPEASLLRRFTAAEREGIPYQRCELVIATPGAAAPAAPAAAPGSEAIARDAQMQTYAHMLFLHQIAAGHSLDVTRDYPDLQDVIQEAEVAGEIEVDVPTATYRLTDKGRQVHRAWMDEAQDLIRRYDIYGDVEVDSTGRARFDTGRGEDWRVAVFEHEGLDPFRARFLLGLNDAEWDGLADWHDVARDPAWYAEIFRPVEQAPGVRDLGEDRLVGVMDQARAALGAER